MRIHFRLDSLREISGFHAGVGGWSIGPAPYEMHYFWFSSHTGELSFTGSRLERIPLHGLLRCPGRRSVKVRVKGLFVWARPVWESETASIEPCDATQNGGAGHVDYESEHSWCSWLTFRSSISTYRNESMSFQRSCCKDFWFSLEFSFAPSRSALLLTETHP